MRRSIARVNDLAADPDDTQPKKPKKMDSARVQFRLNNRPTNLFSRNPNHRHTSKSSLFFFTSLITAIAFFSFFFFFLFRSGNSEDKKFGIIIDGGSTGSRVHVFEYRVKDGAPLFDFGKDGLVSMRVMPGLSSFVEDPERAGGSVEELVDFAKHRVGKEYWGSTEIRLMATAGLRLVDGEVKERILESCRKVLRVSGFKFRDDWVSVISGSDEGLYAWVVANYALGTLGGDPQQTTGIIELGGASAQVTFVSNDPVPPEFSRIVKFGNSSYNLYSHSLLQYGQNVAFNLLRESLLTRGVETATKSIQKGNALDPCTPKGYTHDMGLEKFSPSSSTERKPFLFDLHPSGNFSECRSASLMLLQKGREECPHKHCYIGSTFIPKLRGKFLATENFFHTSKFFRLPPTAFLSDLPVAGQQFCEADWSELRRKYHSLSEEDLLHYCFSSAYIVALLHDSLGISLDDERIQYASQVGDIPLDWALGAFILQSKADLEGEHSSWISYIVSSDSSTWLVFLVFFLVLITAWYMARWRKPQLKTIYDLEKGKYIITRVGRYS